MAEKTSWKPVHGFINIFQTIYFLGKIIWQLFAKIGHPNEDEMQHTVLCDKQYSLSSAALVAALLIWRLFTWKDMRVRLLLFSVRTRPNRPTDPTTQSSLRTCCFFQCCAVSPPQLFPSSTKFVRCPPHPNPNCSTNQRSMCGVPPPSIRFICAVFPPM